MNSFSSLDLKLGKLTAES